VKKSGNLVGEIALASAEQTEGMTQINKAMAQIDQSTQTVASTSEESAAAAEELNAQALTMGDIVKEIGALVGYVGDDTQQSIKKQVMKQPKRNNKDRENKEF
jgi:methyl-accepting chemotaxis protein